MKVSPATYAIIAAVSVCCSAQGQAQDASAFELRGVTAYNSAEILGYAAQIVAQRTGTVRPVDLARTLESIYREDGYFLAEVSVGNDGRTLVVDEGAIGSVRIEGVDEPTFRRVRSYFAPLVGRRPLTLGAFERAIMLTEDIGSISATAEVDYPIWEDLAEVRVVATPEDTSFGYVTLENPPREFGDAAWITLHQDFLSAFTPGDLLRLELSTTQNFEDGDRTVYGYGAYRFPLGGSGVFGELYLGNVDGERDATSQFVATELEGATAVAALGYAAIRDVERYGYGIVELRRTESDIEFGDDRFDSSVDVAGASWIYGRTFASGGALEYALNLAVGRATSDPGESDDGDEDFTHLRAGAGVAVPVPRLGQETAIRAEVFGQYSGDRLPAIEEFYIGGLEGERGYFFAEAQGDSGVSASIEIGHDFFPENAITRRARPFGFLDAGYVTNNDPSNEELPEETFASLGVGIDAQFDANVFVRSYVAVPLTSGPLTEKGDPAFYLGLTKGW